ncbi:MAG: SagB/ThcOx family dehydrogenase [Candidatus Bipolaricaulis sp.]|nr:SagB/ThcOx family dehydrogenase [Candidatus Bipolaricaulis sp.]MDD5646233.1 SagB/ThcOx family dehydrogenase [Candidatus Bipolaricaulis sp.]
MRTIESGRESMKGYPMAFGDDPRNPELHSDQRKGLAAPPVEKPYDKEGARIVALPSPSRAVVAKAHVMDVIGERVSRRIYADQPLSRDQLSFLLWATQAVRAVNADKTSSRRTVPSAGARHPYETHLRLARVEGIEPGLYRYLPLTHELLFLDDRPSLREELFVLTDREEWAADAPVFFLWSCVPYRGEWRYHTMSHKSMLLDAGHIAQNLYLAAEAIGCGVCTLGGYWQEGADRFCGVDGVDEYVVYLAAVGRVKTANTEGV